jgi:hypothetical protein
MKQVMLARENKLSLLSKRCSSFLEVIVVEGQVNGRKLIMQTG